MLTIVQQRPVTSLRACFHGSNRGSNPRGDAIFFFGLQRCSPFSLVSCLFRVLNASLFAPRVGPPMPMLSCSSAPLAQLLPSRLQRQTGETICIRRFNQPVADISDACVQ